jgi:phospholipid/cholesterol/gamma-HCH transport system permease protein
MRAPADFERSEDNGEAVLRFSGNLSLACLGDLPARLETVEGGVARLDLREVGRMDTVGAWVVHRFARDRGARIEGLGADEQHLLEQVIAAEHPIQLPPPPPGSLTRALDEIGKAVINSGKTLYGLLGFMGATVLALWHVITHPRRFRFNATVQRFEVVGVGALGIIALMSFLIGIVIAQQGSVQLRQFGAEIYTINLLGRLTLRELGILMTAIMIAGRSGSAFAAQLGTMKLTEEIDAMRTIGVSILGGGLLCWVDLGITPVTFISRIREVVPLTDLWVGLVKAPVFGAIIAMAGCFHGMQVEGDAEQVGQRTTTAVVQAIFLVIVLDAFFAVFFTNVGWT